MSEKYVKDECCGCGACYAICPRSCISLKITERKSTVMVKGDDCISCGLCEKVCPVKNKKNIFFDKQPFFYKAISLNTSTLAKSSSGGIAHEIAKRIIGIRGVVYGAAWNIENQRVEHVRIENIDDLSGIQGSKYVQSYISSDIYKTVCTDIKDKVVLFIGTPCEVTAIRNVVGNNDNLVCIDLICHGVPSHNMFAEQLKAITKRRVVDLSFRDGLHFRLRIDDGERVYTKDWEDNPYYSLYMHFASLREYCYNCKFACEKRVGDITLGDYVEKGKRFSCVILNTQKGRMWAKRISSGVTFEKRNIELLKQNHSFNTPTVKHQKTDIFTKMYDKLGLINSYNICFIKFRIKRLLKRILGDSFYNRVKSILCR